MTSRRTGLRHTLWGGSLSQQADEAFGPYREDRIHAMSVREDVRMQRNHDVNRPSRCASMASFIAWEPTGAFACREMSYRRIA